MTICGNRRQLRFISLPSSRSNVFNRRFHRCAQICLPPLPCVYFQDAYSLLIRDLDRVCRTIARRVAKQAIRDARRSKRCAAVLAISLHDYFGNSYTKCEMDPQQIAMHRELVHNVLKDWDPLKAMLVELRLQGWTNPEIASHIGSTTRQVQRQLNRIHKQLSRWFYLGQKTKAVGLRV